METHSAMGRSQNDGMSAISRSKSLLFKKMNPTIFSDKAMQLNHIGMNIKQITVGQVEKSIIDSLRTRASKSKNTGRYSYLDRSVSFIEPERQDKFSKVLVVHEMSKGVVTCKIYL